MEQPTQHLRRLNRRSELMAATDWRWTRHALQRMRQRWPRLARPELEAALARARVLQRQAARCDLLVILPGHELAIFVVDGAVVVTGFPAAGGR